MWWGKSSSSSSSSSLSSSWVAFVWIAVIGCSNSWIEKGYGFSATSEAATMAKNRLKESLSSMSGKMTLSAELVIPDPSDPTALLLLATEVTDLSQNIRVKAKANAAFIEVLSLSSLSNFCQEQETARGNFPGPLPVIYCPPNGADPVDLEELAATGACGVLVPLLGGEELTSVSDIADKVSSETVEYCAKALQNGLQPIPEIVLSKSFLQQKPTDDNDSDDDVVSSILDAIVEKCDFPKNELPAALVLSASMIDDSVELAEEEEEEEEEESDEEKEEIMYGLPRVSKELKKKLPVLASVRVMAGAGRVGAAVSSLKDAGYTGAALRSECVPGYRMNPDLKAVSGFWNACISDLKSVKSKNFAGFRVNSNMEKSVPMEWLKYQKNVIDSGALGEASGPPEDLESLDADAGDYVGF